MEDLMIDREKLRELAEHQVALMLIGSDTWPAKVLALLDALEAAEGERDQLREDADRYRWLRDKANDVEEWGPMVFNCNPGRPIEWSNSRHGESLDASIDVARKA
jgi:hypothetical protein